ncbi:MAG: hypothetical protein LDLANPLL_02586 [Turneriella sp.]|nr:hypothetical protein [Turneriella sp.]
MLTPTFAAELKRRVLVLPFDNTLKNKNYAWMSESTADNLKTEILKSGKFEVLDVTLLRKIDPNMQFANLDAKNASAFAARLNCEVAVVGRFKVRKEGRAAIVTFAADGVDALEKKLVVTKNEDAVINAEIFDSVATLARSISDELNNKLEPLDADEYRRDNRLEKLIRRLQNPPKGFLDSVAIVGSPDSGSAEFTPAFDIDTFKYDAYINYDQADGVEKYKVDYQYWGKRLMPEITATDASCKLGECKFNGRKSTLTIFKTSGNKTQPYTIRLHLPHPGGPVIARWWVTAGYPYTTNIAAFGQSSPEALSRGGGIPFGAMRGFGHLEFGLGTERLQFGNGFKWAWVTQLFYGEGNMPEFSTDSGYNLKLRMFSAGGGLRLDRPIFLGSRYAFSPFVGFYVHYQRFFREVSGPALNAAAIVPELGINQYFRFGYKRRYRWVLTLAAGSFVYSGQNLTYARAGFGIEYSFK